MGVNKTIWWTVIISFLVIVMVGVVAYLCISRHRYEVSLQIKDKNGESKELCVVTDGIIRDCIEDYRMIGKHIRSRGKSESGVTGKYINRDNSYTKIEIGMLSGIYICNAYLGNGDRVKYVIDSQVNSGNFRIIITDDGSNILYDIPIDEKQEVSFVAEASQLYYVKLVGESANIHIELWRETDAANKVN